MAPCPEFLEHGVCTTDGCDLNHALRICRMCRIWCVNDDTFEMHLHGKKHASVVKNGGVPVPKSLVCNVCNTTIPGDQHGYQLHVAGRRHRALATGIAQAGGGSVQVASLPDAHCTVCGIDLFENHRAAHERTEAHRKKTRFAVYRAAFDEAERDKAGVAVEEEADFPFLDAPSKLAKPITAQRSVGVTFSSSDTGVYLVAVRMSSSMSPRGEKKYVQGL